IGTAGGENRAAEAAKMAISSPLLEESVEGATGILLNITGGRDLGLFEVNEAAEIVSSASSDDSNIIFGAVIDEAMGDDVRVTVIATGFDREPGTSASAPGEASSASRPRRTVTLDGGHAAPRYKGEPALRDLDVPAYERRTPVPPAEPAERPAREVEETRARAGLLPDDAPRGDGEAPRPANVRRLHHGEFVRERQERIRKDDPDTPAFLRKMLD
ncbi:MAG TPA: hypothetical protein VD838_13440, partial [Anaeromyxobacteraceae bacterium]|nr:hypothetical protein [Anaeromyxobacteraceae bacterium]